MIIDASTVMYNLHKIVKDYGIPLPFEEIRTLFLLKIKNEYNIKYGFSDKFILDNLYKLILNNSLASFTDFYPYKINYKFWSLKFGRTFNEKDLYLYMPLAYRWRDFAEKRSRGISTKNLFIHSISNK